MGDRRQSFPHELVVLVVVRRVTGSIAFGSNIKTNSQRSGGAAAGLKSDCRLRALLTPALGDFGMDLISTNASGQRVVMQAKRYQGSVGVHAIQKKC